MFFQRRTIPGLAINSYIIGDDKTKECAVIDPVRDVEAYVNIAQKNQLHIAHILETHVHADFVSGSLELKTRLKGKPTIHCSGMGGKKWIPDYADHVLRDNDEIRFGDLRFRAVHTPGHTPEHIMWVLYDKGQLKKLFTGDFLFVGTIGRPDLLGEQELYALSHQLYQSVFHRLDEFPDSAEVRPAHGAGSLCGKGLQDAPSSTLGAERQHNPSLVKKPEKQWINALMQNMPPAPKYFPRMKKINIDGATIIGKHRPGLRALSPREVYDHMEKGAVVLDVRSKEDFATAHIPNAINIPLGLQFSTWSGSIQSPDQPIILVIDEEKQLNSVIDSLLRVGLDKIVGYLSVGVSAWKEQGYETRTLQALSIQEFHEKLNGEYPPYVLDVRTDPEWDAGHIQGAHHIPVALVLQQIDSIPTGGHISVICGSGYRASIAASLLQKEGFFDVSVVFGGMTAWNEQQFPVEPEKRS